MKQDLTGKRFGKLTVISRNPLLEDRYHTWNCRCDCGGEIVVNTKRLTRGTVTNCGCIPKKQQHRVASADLVGMTFGNLTVLKRAGSRAKRAMWLCKCDCGNETLVSTHDLRSGHTKSCGCRSHTALPYRDLTGQRFGYLTVVKRTDSRDNKGSVLWLCHCDCGKDALCSSSTLVHGKTKSCGCYRENEIRKKINDTLHRVNGTCIERLNLKKPRSDNKSGYVGVHKINENRYQARIGFQGKRYCLGTYAKLEDAVKARQRGEEMHLDFLDMYYREKSENEGKKEEKSESTGEHLAGVK